MPTQLIKLALVDTSAITDGGDPSTADIETFSIFQEGAQDASRQVVSIEANTSLLENNREVITSKVYTIDVVGLYSQSKRSKLHTWSQDRTPLYITGYGLDGSVLYAYGAITVVEGFDGNASFRFRFQNESVGGYDASTSIHSSFMSYCHNGFSIYKWEQNPSGASLNPKMFGTSNPPIELDRTLSVIASDPELLIGTPTRGWSSGWRVQCDAGDTFFNYSRVWFPFSGVTVHFTIDTAISTGGSPTDSLISIRPKDENDVTLANFNIEFTSGTQKTISGELPADTQTILFTLRTGEDTTIVWNNPTWSIGSAKTYTEFYT